MQFPDFIANRNGGPEPAASRIRGRDLRIQLLELVGVSSIPHPVSDNIRFKAVRFSYDDIAPV